MILYSIKNFWAKAFLCMYAEKCLHPKEKPVSKAFSKILEISLMKT